jgi:hypothetical protein
MRREVILEKIELTFKSRQSIFKEISLFSFPVNHKTFPSKTNNI